jgi:site-specific recombinase XerD
MPKALACDQFQKLMGHWHIGTTALYRDVSDEQLQNAVALV